MTKKYQLLNIPTMNLEQLDKIVQGQAERNVLETSMREYIGRCATMTNILYNLPELRYISLQHDDDGNAVKHTGLAKKVYKIIQPMEISTARRLFGLIAIDKNLPRKIRKRGYTEIQEASTSVEEITIVVNSVDPGANIATVTAQTYQTF